MAYDLSKLAADLGRTVNPALQPIIEGLRDGEVAKLSAEIEEMQREFLQSSQEVRRQHDYQIRSLLREFDHRLKSVRLEARSEAVAGVHNVMLPFAGQVPSVVDGVHLPLLRIRWQEFQPNGEGEMPVPAGWVLDDDQSGTWLDAINSRSLQP